LSFEVIERLRVEIRQGAPRSSEAGGLLIGVRRSQPGVMKIVDFIPLPGEPNASDPHFRLASASLAEAIARCPSDNRIVGYYRSDINQQVHLRPDDLEVIRQWFKEPLTAFLIIADTDDTRSTAGFFFWERDTVAANPSLTFPFSAEELAAGGWPQHQESVNQSGPASLPRQLRDMLLRASGLARVAVLSGLIAMLIGVKLITNSSASPHAAPASSAPLKLQVQKEGVKFHVTWDRSAPQVSAAKDAMLVIWDESRETWDDSKEPLYMPLASPQLLAGGVTYTPFFYTEKIKFRLDTMDASGNKTSESMVFVSPAPSAPDIADNARSADSRPLARSTLSTPDGNSLLHRKVVPSSKSANRTFVPPKPPIAVKGETVMPEPPKIRAEPPASVPVNAAPPSNQPSQNAEMPQVAPNVQGLVTITSDPSGAHVEINAVPAGVTPITLQINPVGLGFTVVVSKPGYAKWTVQTISTVQPYSLHAQLRPIPK
jgi:hypothetical protein